MVEAMKIFIAYALVSIGIPIIVGHIFGLICSMPISLIVGLSRRGAKTPAEAAEAGARDTMAWMFRGGENMAMRDRIAHASLDLFNGIGAILVAGLVFHLFGLHPGLAVLGIVALWELGISFAQPTQAKVQNRLDLSVWGVVIGWMAVLWLFPAS